MPRTKTLKFDEIGYWSEVKLDIIKDYASEYTKILSKQKYIKKYVYIEGFSGCGKHLSKTTGQLISGSPVNALKTKPAFSEYYFIDSDKIKTDYLEKEIKNYTNAHILNDNCNVALLKKIFPKIQYSNFARGLCVLDPYGLQLNWEVIKTAGQLKTIDIFLNFPVMDINRRVLWHNPDKIPQEYIEPMNAFWGDDSWKQVAYTKDKNLFKFVEKEDTEVIINAFQKRLKEIAGFGYVPNPIPMRNSKNSIVYYLFFASQKPVADTIIKHIFNKYKNRGVN